MEKINQKLMSWASILESQTREQAELSSRMPFIFPHVALMPDAHLGKGATVGSVLPTLGAVMPAAVGVDIGCGMVAVRTQYDLDGIAGLDRAQLRRAIETAVPLSAGHNNATVSESASRRVATLTAAAAATGARPFDHAPNWPYQLGSLGSGNHFIEVTVDEEQRVWLFLHSGSRGVGNKMAVHHIAVAQELCRRWWVDLPHPDLAYLVEDTDEFDSYIHDLMWAQDFALQNREEMMDRVVDCFADWVGTPVEEEDRINCHHNFTQVETHFGRRVWVSRKGAIEARKGTRGLVPGSMGTASYVVEGLGNAVALHSSPHGAGRVYSRTKARKTFTREDLRQAMQGIEYRDSDAFLDEIPGAYKDVDVVMADAKDLVRIVHTFHQIINVKGD